MANIPTIGDKLNNILVELTPQLRKAFVDRANELAKNLKLTHVELERIIEDIHNEYSMLLIYRKRLQKHPEEIEEVLKYQDRVWDMFAKFLGISRDEFIICLSQRKDIRNMMDEVEHKIRMVPIEKAQKGWKILCPTENQIITCTYEEGGESPQNRNIILSSGWQSTCLTYRTGVKNALGDVIATPNQPTHYIEFEDGDVWTHEFNLKEKDILGEGE